MSLSDEEKIRVLEKRVRKLELLLARGGVGLHLFHPASNTWVPAQCDEYGRQVIDPSDLDTRYLKLDDPGTITGRVDIEAPKEVDALRIGSASKEGGDFRMYGIDGLNTIFIDASSGIVHNYGVRPLVTMLGSLGSSSKWYNEGWISTLQVVNMIWNTGTATMNTRNAHDTDYLQCRSWDGEAYLVNWKVMGGNILLPSLPVADPEVVGILWNDGGTVKISAG